jgi:LuxR family maltose regulon positive regulatory protein
MTGMSAAGVARPGRGRSAVTTCPPRWTAVRKRVTIISAPVGSGKTSLLHAWADWPGQDRRITITRIR